MKRKASYRLLLIHDLVQSIDIGKDTGTDDVGGDAPSGIDLALVAQLHHGLTHGFPALGDGLDLEIVQLVVAAHDLFNGKEGGINGTVTDVNTP